jgi:acetoacetyl-CoA synthetase
VANSTAASMTEVLTAIWQRLLNRPSIGIEEDFFDLGGDRELASKLFSEIAQVYGRDVSPEMMLHAPTVASLSALLEKPAPLRLPAVVRLKAGTEGPPVFIIPGLGGTLLDLVQLARHVETPQAIYGLVARGVDGQDEPFDCVEDMAPFYLDAIRKLQTRGPYFLIGNSFGGLVAMEMARHLAESGERIGLLCMLDTYPHTRHLSLLQRAGIFMRKARHHAAAMAKMPIREAVPYFMRRLKSRLPGSGDGRMRVLERQAGEYVSPVKMRVRVSDDLALERYQPHFYGGKVKYVKAQDGWYFPFDAAAVWDKLVKDFEVETVPGDHLGMTVTHYENIAGVLSRYLQEGIQS